MSIDGPPSPSERVPGADAATVARIDSLSAATHDAEPGHPAAWGPLWQATFGLREWLFIARGAPQSPRPFIGVLEQGPMLFAFTTAERARIGALSLGLSEAESGSVLTVPTPGVVDWVVSLAQNGVFGISFDHPTTGYFTPLANLIGIRDWVASQA